MKLSIICTLFLFIGSANAQVIISAKDPRPSLKRELQVLDQVSKYIDKPEAPRLKTIRDTVEGSLKIINEHTNVAHRESVQSIQRVVLVFRYSQAYFDLIKSELLSSRISEMQSIAETLAKDFGFDLAEGTNIVELILRQIHSLTTQLLEADLPEDLRKDLNLLLPQLGRGIAAASTGDRPNAYAAADDIYVKINALYEKFNKVSVSQSGFALVQELVELNEFYANYGQVNTRMNKGGTK